MTKPDLQSRHRTGRSGGLFRRRRLVERFHEDELQTEVAMLSECEECEDSDGDYDLSDYALLSDERLSRSSFEQEIHRFLSWPRLIQLLPEALSIKMESAVQLDSESAGFRSDSPFASARLADEVFLHIRRIVLRACQQCFASSDEVTEAMLLRGGGMQGIKKLQHRFSMKPGALVMALLFAPFWVRPLANWNEAAELDDVAVMSLIKHLFVVYPVPEALLRAWGQEQLPALKWVFWLILLGQGGSLHNAGQRFGWRLTERFAACFLMAPVDLLPIEACMWAECIRLGGEPIDFERIRRCPALVIDPTEAPETAPEAAIILGRLPGPGVEEATVSPSMMWEWLLQDRSERLVSVERRLRPVDRATPYGR